MHFWQVVILLDGGFKAPVKYGFSGVIPALISSMEGSSSGIREKLFNLRCPLLSKNFRNSSLNVFNDNFSISITILI
jgi:hypothetical protein